MYYNFYQLKENPFNMTADPDFFYSTQCHLDALSNLIYGIEYRKGILVITGEIGTGKTTLCRKLLQQSNKQTKFAFILNPTFSEIQLLQIIINDLGIRTVNKSKFDLIQALNEFLIAESNKGNNVVLIIDETQNLGVNQLEQIRLLSNLETEKEKLLQIILVGQPELLTKLELPALGQLRQRIAIHFHVQPLAKADIKNYILHRIEKARQETLTKNVINFTDDAIDSIYQYTKGSPRSINILCDRALLAGYAAETFQINEATIETCAREVLYFERHL